MKQQAIALIGVGRWGTNLLRNLLQHPQVKVTAIVDTSPSNLQACQAKFGLNPREIFMTQDWRAVRQNCPIDAVVVATPAVTHYGLIKDALELGYHVLAEKPLTLSIKECVELTELAQKQHKQLLVDHTYLFHPAIAKGKEVIDAGKIGKPLYAYASRTHLGPVRQDVDALWDLAIHDLAILNHWLGEMPFSVRARGQTWLQKETREPPPGTPDVADLVWLELKYSNDITTTIHVCWLNPDKQRRLVLVGSKASLVFDELVLEETLVLQKGHLEKRDKGFIPTGQGKEILTIPPVEPLKQVCDQFVSSLFEQTIDSTSGELATNLVQILTCLSISLRSQGREISITT